MSAAITAAVIAAGATYYGTQQQKKAQEKAAKQGGRVDTTTTSTPWGPSTDHRTWIMDHGRNIVGGGQGAPTPAAGTVVKGNPKAKNPKNRKDRVVGGAAPGEQFNGNSAGTRQIQQAMIDQAQRGNPLYGEAEDYISGTLGGEDRNGYRTETADMLRGLSNDDLRRFTDELWEGNMPGSGGNQRNGQTASEARSRGYGSGAYGTQAAALAAHQAQAASMVGVRDDLRGILDGGDTPGAQAMRDRIRRQGEEAYAEMAKDLRLRSVGSGMYGGTPYQQAESSALARSSMGITDAIAAQDYATYNNALGLGTQYDISAQDRAAQERASANASASSGRAAEAGIASQERMARMGMLQNAIGMQLDTDKYRTSGMGSLADMFSQDQRHALSGVPDITGLGMRDWGAAGQFSLGADNARNDFTSSQNSRAVGMAGVGLGRQQLAFDRERFYDPLARLGQYTDIVNGASGAYGTRTETGTDTRAQSPTYVPNEWGQAAAAGLGTYGAYRGYQNTAQQPAPVIQGGSF